MKRLIRAIEILREDMEDANVRLLGRMPPLVTIQLQEAMDEARYFNFLRTKANSEESLQYLNRHQQTKFRPDVFGTIAGVDVRITSDHRIDDIVRRNFK